MATDALPEQVQKLFRRVIPTGIAHGTVTVLVGDTKVELTTLRGEGGYSDGRRPDSVSFSRSIEEDLLRRDFTVNAIAFDPLCETLTDPFGGIADIRAQRLRAVGVAEQRFGEDGLRVLRAARFAATLEYEIDDDTRRAIRPSLASYAKVSAERIREEWQKALGARRPSRAFSIMQSEGMLELTAPCLMAMVGCEQNRHHAYDVWEHTLHVVDALPATEPRLRLAALLHDVGKPVTRAVNPETSDYTFYHHEQVGARIADELLVSLKASHEERDYVTHLVRHHLVVYDSTWTDAAVRRWLRRVGPGLARDVIALGRADILAKGRDVTEELERLALLEVRAGELMRAKTALDTKDLELDGRVLIAELGLAPGRVVGQLLRALLEDVLEDPELNQRARLLERAALHLRKLPQ